MKVPVEPSYLKISLLPELLTYRFPSGPKTIPSGSSRPPLPAETKVSMKVPGVRAKTGFTMAVKDEPNRVIPKNTTITFDRLSSFPMFETLFLGRFATSSCVCN